MKTVILFLSLFFLTTGCSQNKQEPKQQENAIYGTWQLIEQFSHPPTGDGWTQVKNGFEIAINVNNTFNSSQFSDCETGNVILIAKQISFVYSCKGFTKGYGNPPRTFEYSYQIVNNILELTPQNFTCYEGCKYRLIKKN